MSEALGGSEQFLLISLAITAAGASLAAILQFVLKSRCTRIRMGCLECDRDVVAAEAATIDTTALSNI